MFLAGDTFKYCGTKEFKKEDGTVVTKDYCLSGWIAIHCTIEQSNAVDPDFIRNKVYQPNHLRLYVRNKLAVENYFTLRRNTQTMANYIEGEISFDILDDDDLPDIATSSRQDFMADERIELLSSIVDPILTTLFKLRNKVGHEISEEDTAYTKFLIEEEEKKRRAEAESRAKAEEEAKANKEAKEEAEAKQKEAEAIAEREIKRSKYILSVSDIEDKNIMNSVHSIYNMSNRVKENLDEINNLPELSVTGRKKLAKAATSNQRILSVSKLISKAGRIIDDNDAVKQVDLTVFVEEYVKNALCNIYQDDIEIQCDGDLDSSHFIKIKPLSFIMMIDNLIGNSIKANAKLLTVIIDNSNVDQYQIIFKDDGRGIDPTIADTDRLFEFGVTTTNGSGLGLYYAHKYMNSIHGQISIKNNNENGVSVTLAWKK